jgi:hypothetical protein
VKLPLLVALTAIAACGPSAVPTPAQEARIGTYSAALEACNAQLALEAKQAKAAGDADRAALEARYEACAHDVDVRWGRAK